MPAGWQVCPCLPAVMQFRGQLLTHSYLSASQSWHLSADALVTGVSGRLCSVKVFTLIICGFTSGLSVKLWRLSGFRFYTQMR